MSAGNEKVTDVSAKRRKLKKADVGIIVIAVVGLLVLLYPMTANWFSTRAHEAEVTGYIESVASLPMEDKARQLTEAREYSQALPRGPLRDPYANSTAGEETAIGEGAEEYFDRLRTPGSQTMGRVRIASIGVDLPLYHGTDETTLSKGVGHLYGTALPVGGVGTHSVLTAHSGLASAELFTDLERVPIDDVFTVTVLGETLYYRVDQIETVLPHETDAVQTIDGKDYLTLITCTPVAVNSHRLLVRGERVDPPFANQEKYEVPGTGKKAGFPLWGLLLVGATGAFVLALVIPAKKRKTRKQEKRDRRDSVVAETGGESLSDHPARDISEES